jgi:hypothetical protein
LYVSLSIQAIENDRFNSYQPDQLSARVIHLDLLSPTRGSAWDRSLAGDNPQAALAS